MNRVAFLACVLIQLFVAVAVFAQPSYPDFALVVHVPSYEAFLKNLGDSPIRVDGYQIGSASGSLDPAGWAPMDFAGPEIVAALGPGADEFFVANTSATSLAELNPLSSATWQPGQSWSIGFPFDSDDPDFVLDPVFRFASPDGLVLTGGVVVPPSQLALAALVVVPEPSAFVLVALVGSFTLTCARARRTV